jgi:hypothetical protein
MAIYEGIALDCARGGCGGLPTRALSPVPSLETSFMQAWRALRMHPYMDICRHIQSLKAIEPHGVPRDGGTRHRVHVIGGERAEWSQRAWGGWGWGGGRRSEDA